VSEEIERQVVQVMTETIKCRISEAEKECENYCRYFQESGFSKDHNIYTVYVQIQDIQKPVS
jgi:hypothetical protein